MQEVLVGGPRGGGMEPKTIIVWRPQSRPQLALVQCPLQEVFFGGARGGGKTDGVLGKWALKERRYGPSFNAMMFRRTTVSSEDAIERSRQIYEPLGGKFNESKLRWRMPNGGRAAFAYLDSVIDADEYQGRNLTDVWIEEAGQYPDPSPIDRLFATMRSAQGIPVQMILTANPGGAGQLWLADRYKLIPFPPGPRVIDVERPSGIVTKAAVIPSRITDNRVLLDKDAGYIDRLRMVGSRALVQAWLAGDWSAIEGAFFDCWDQSKHVVAPFAVPKDWLRFRSFDWGSAAPFSVGWWTVAGDDIPLPRNSYIATSDRHEQSRMAGDGLHGMHGGADHERQRLAASVIPRGALVRYREWYGASGPNKGLKLTIEEVAKGILERDAGDTITYSVADPSIFAEDGGPSRAEVFSRAGVHFAPADNKRVSGAGAMGGWDEMRQRLKGKAGVPMLYAFDTCRDFIRTIPVLPHDPKRAEDVDTDAEDHAADEARYACMSRPWVPQKDEPIRNNRSDYRSRERNNVDMLKVL